MYAMHCCQYTALTLYCVTEHSSLLLLQYSNKTFFMHAAVYDWSCMVLVIHVLNIYFSSVHRLVRVTAFHSCQLCLQLQLVIDYSA
jgi:hypothetical protein